MFNTLKKTFNNAFQEASIITENLHQQYRQRVSAPDIILDSNRSSETSALDLGLPFDVNATSGCNVLSKYEFEWKSIHQNNVENSERAQEISQQIRKIEAHMTSHHGVLNELLKCLAGASNLVARIKVCQETLNDVIHLSQDINKELEKLEDLSEECELQEYLLGKQCEISKYKQRKMENLEVYRQKIATEHQQRIDKHERNLRKIQRERQEVFDDAFRHDLEEFKQKGHIPSKFAFIIPILSEIHATINDDVGLEEVVLDDTESKDALEDFLNG